MILYIFAGKIACANVLSDLYAMGVTECDNMLQLLGVSMKMTEKERDVVIPLIMRGFKDSACEAGTRVTGGQTVVNPWCIIGGVASTVCQPNEYIVYVPRLYYKCMFWRYSVEKWLMLILKYFSRTTKYLRKNNIFHR